MHLALGGCLKTPPVNFGVTADTGGHIAYVLDAAAAQSRQPGVERISIATRLFDDPCLGLAHGLPRETLGENTTIDRIATNRRIYLEKEALAAELPAFSAALRAHLERLPRLPNVIHAHFADAAAVALEMRQCFGIPFVYTPHALGIDKQSRAASPDGLGGRIAAERRAIAMADAIIVSTRDEAERQICAYGVPAAAARITCLRPGVPRRDDAAALAGRLDHWLDDPDKAILLAIARPVRKKNLAGLVRACRSTPGLLEHANLVILAGQHSDRQSAEEQAVIRELDCLSKLDGLRGRVALPPKHNAADVTGLYAKASRGGVFANTAHHEPFGLTLIEAAAAGVPVVATRNGGPAEIVDTIGHGLLVDPRDEAGIGTACLRIVSDPDLHRRLAQNASRNIHRYDWAGYAARSVSLYASLRRAGSSPAPGPGPQAVAA